MTTPLNDAARLVGEYYDEKIFAEELVRLPERFPIEFAVTRRHLDRRIKDGWKVADVGVGGGQYAEHLARRKCQVNLIDVSDRLLEATRTRLIEAGLGDRIGICQIGSATALPLEDASMDAVLMLGPLYHLQHPPDRSLAVDEAARVLRPGGLIFAAGINRLTYLRDLFNGSLANAPDFDFIKKFMRDGNLNPEVAPPIGHAHLTTITEFTALFNEKFGRLILTGLESFAGDQQRKLRDMPPEIADRWLDVIEQSGRTNDGIGLSDHFLYVGSRF